MLTDVYLERARSSAQTLSAADMTSLIRLTSQSTVRRGGGCCIAAVDELPLCALSALFAIIVWVAAAFVRVVDPGDAIDHAYTLLLIMVDVGGGRMEAGEALLSSFGGGVERWWRIRIGPRMGWCTAASTDRGGLTTPKEYARDRWGHAPPRGVVATRWGEEEEPIRRMLAVMVYRWGS